MSLLASLSTSSVAAGADAGLVGQLTDRLDDDWLSTVVDAAIGPGLTILLILVVAEVVSLVARRLIRRAVARSKEPSSGRRDDLRRRVGLAEGDPVPTERRAQRAEAVGALGGSIVSVAIWTVAAIMILSEVGVQVGPLIAGAGIVGVALGFGAQDLVKDFLSGVFMLLEDQYGVGDVVDAGEAVGVVEGISLRTTRIRDVTGTLWHVANGQIVRVGNMSQEWARALLDVDVSYGTDIDAASDLIQRLAADMAAEPDYAELFLGEPEMWGVQDLGTDSVVLRLVIKTRPGEQWAITRELRRRIKVAFDVAEVEIPFPQRTVWLRAEHPVALGGEETAPWEERAPDEPTRRRALEMAAASSGAEQRGSGDTVPDAAEATEHGGDPSAEQAEED